MDKEGLHAALKRFAASHNQHGYGTTKAQALVATRNRVELAFRSPKASRMSRSDERVLRSIGKRFGAEMSVWAFGLGVFVYSFHPMDAYRRRNPYNAYARAGHTVGAGALPRSSTRDSLVSLGIGVGALAVITFLTKE